MKRRGLKATVFMSFVMAFPALVGAQGDTSRATQPAPSSTRSSVPTGDALADRRAVDEEKSDATTPAPRVREGDSPPVITVPPVAPAGD